MAGKEKKNPANTGKRRKNGEKREDVALERGTLARTQ